MGVFDLQIGAMIEEIPCKYQELIMIKKIQIGDVPFPIINYDDAIEVYQEWINARTAHQVCIVNVHTLVTAMRESSFRLIMQEASMNTMDGQPLKWYANTVCHADVNERVCGPELMLRCLDQGVDKGWRHYFLGGRPEVLSTLQLRVQERFPGVNIVGSYSPPFRPITDIEESETVTQINETNADFLWVGLGAPRQEQWIHRNLHRLNVPVCVGVGAAFDFHAGTVKRAPAWMQKAGLEWLFRACADPRLFRRYLDTNPQFLWMLVWDSVRVRLFRQTVACDDQI